MSESAEARRDCQKKVVLVGSKIQKELVWILPVVGLLLYQWGVRVSRGFVIIEYKSGKAVVEITSLI